MKKYINYLKKDKLIQRLSILSFILIIVSVVYIVLNYKNLPPLFPLFNHLAWGERRLSSTPGIFIPAIIVSVMFFMNLILSALSYSSSPLIARLISITSFLIALLNVLFIIRTIELIT